MQNTSQTTLAETLGMVSYEQGVKAPVLCKQTMQLAKESEDTKSILEAWTRGYNKAKRIKMQEFFKAKMAAKA